MNLVDTLKVMNQAGFTQVKDTHSRFFKNIEELMREAALDLNDYTPNVRTGEIVQNPPNPNTHYQCQ